MTAINYPCETAAIFQGVIFVIRPQSKSDLATEISKVEDFYLSYFPYATTENIWDGIRYSFGGLYLSNAHVYREAQWNG